MTLYDLLFVLSIGAAMAGTFWLIRVGCDVLADRYDPPPVTYHPVRYPEPRVFDWSAHDDL